MEKKNDDGLNEIMERMQNIDKADFDERKELGLILGFFLHPNSWIHLILTFLIVLGTLGVFCLFAHYTSFKFFTYSNFGYILGISLMFSLMDYVVKYFITKYTPKLMTYTMGLCLFFFYFLWFWFLDFILHSNFSYQNLMSYLTFVLVFGIVKLVITILLRRLVFSIFFEDGDE